LRKPLISTGTHMAHRLQIETRLLLEAMATVMNRIFFGALIAALCDAFGGDCAAQVSLVDYHTIVSVPPRTQFVSAYQYKAARERIVAEFASARKSCEGLRTYAREACLEEARANHSMATAELDARRRYTLEAYRKARLLRKESPYLQARQKCLGLTLRVRKHCLDDVQASFGLS